MYSTLRIHTVGRMAAAHALRGGWSKCRGGPDVCHTITVCLAVEWLRPMLTARTPPAPRRSGTVLAAWRCWSASADEAARSMLTLRVVSDVVSQTELGPWLNDIGVVVTEESCLDGGGALLGAQAYARATPAPRLTRSPGVSSPRMSDLE
eukprot:gene8949-biopygen7626